MADATIENIQQPLIIIRQKMMRATRLLSINDVESKHAAWIVAEQMTAFLLLQIQTCHSAYGPLSALIFCPIECPASGNGSFAPKGCNWGISGTPALN